MGFFKTAICSALWLTFTSSLCAEILVRVSDKERINHAVLTGEQRIYYATSDAIYTLDARSCGPPRRVEFVGSDAQSAESGYGLREVRAITATPSGRVWIGTKDGIYAVDTVRAQRRLASVIGDTVTVSALELTAPASNDFWAGTSNGLYYVSEGENATLQCMDEGSERRGESGAETCAGEAVSALKTDAVGRLWVATHGGRIYALENKPPNAARRRPTVLAQIEIGPSQLVDDLFASGGQVWATTVRLGGQMSYSEGYLLEEGEAKRLFPADSDIMTSVVAEVMGRTWLGTNRGIFVYEPGNHRQVEGFYGAVNALSAIGNEVLIGTDWSLYQGYVGEVAGGHGALRLLAPTAEPDAKGGRALPPLNGVELSDLEPSDRDPSELELRVRGILEDGQRQWWTWGETGLYFLERNVDFRVEPSHFLAWTGNLAVDVRYEGTSAIGCALTEVRSEVIIETQRDAFRARLKSSSFQRADAETLPFVLGSREVHTIAADEHFNLSQPRSGTVFLLLPATSFLVPVLALLVLWLVVIIALPLSARRFPRVGIALNRRFPLLRLPNRALLYARPVYRRFFRDYLREKERVFKRVDLEEATSLNVINALESTGKVVMLGESAMDVDCQLKVVMGRLLHGGRGIEKSFVRKVVPIPLKIDEMSGGTSLSKYARDEISGITGLEPGIADALLRCARFVFIVHGPGLQKCSEQLKGEFVRGLGARSRVLIGTASTIGLGESFTVVDLSKHRSTDNYLTYSIETQIEELKDKIARLKSDVGEEDGVTLAAMNNLAETFRALHRFEEARDLHARVLELSRRALGQDHPDTLISMGNLAETLRALGEEDQAKSLESEMFRVRPRVAAAATEAGEPPKDFRIRFDQSISRARALDFFAALGATVAQSGGRLSIADLSAEGRTADGSSRSS